MRPRGEISNQVDHPADESSTHWYAYGVATNTALAVEVLLDIRDMLATMVLSQPATTAPTGAGSEGT